MKTYYFVLLDGRVEPFEANSENMAFNKANSDHPFAVVSSGYLDLVIAEELASGIREENQMWCKPE